MAKEAASKETAIDKLGFEEALAELEKIVRQLETGGADLNTAIDSYERGIALKQYCEKRLKEAQARIEKITVSADGTPKTEALSAEAFTLSE